MTIRLIQPEVEPQVEKGSSIQDSSQGILSAISVDRASNEPLYLQIREQILHEIGVAQLLPGSLLPSIRQLATHLGVTTGTVRHAYTVLESEGIVTSHQGKGMLVADLVDSRRRSRQLPRSLTSQIGDLAHQLSESANDDENFEFALVQYLTRNKHTPEILLVSDSKRWNEYYVPSLNSALQDSGIVVTSALLVELREHPFKAYNPLSPPELVLTFVPTFVEVSSLLEGSHATVYPMALSLSDQSKADLMAMPRGLRVALVAARNRVTGIRHIIEQYLVGAIPIHELSIEELEAGTPLPESDLVLYSLGVSDRILPFLRPDDDHLQIYFVPDSMFIKSIKEILAEMSMDNPI